MNELKFTDRLGLLDIFGIISPGIFILLTLLFCITGLVYVFRVSIENIAINEINSILRDWMILIIILVFFASYLFGSVVRLFANDFAEAFSGFYLSKIRRNKTPFAIDRFPYPFAGKSFKNSNMEVYTWYKKKYKFFGDEGELNQWDKKYFFNRCKADLYARSPERALFYERIESFVRFLAGALVSNLVLFIVTLSFGIYFLRENMGFLAAIYIAFSIFSFVVVIAILEKFRNQHTREVMALWTSYYEACQESKK
jgi:hypothetical protein